VLTEFQYIPTILNVDNHRTGPGAIFDYSKALRTENALPPKGLSEAIPFRFRFKQPFVTTFTIQTGVTGFVQKPGEQGQPREKSLSP
jgi:hypothetical protein